MKIVFSKRYLKSLKKLPVELKERVYKAITEFSNDPHNPRLRNHKLQGKLDGKRAFSITGDVRIIFEEFDGYVLVIFLDIGKHNQVYE